MNTWPSLTPLGRTRLRPLGDGHERDSPDFCSGGEQSYRLPHGVWCDLKDRPPRPCESSRDRAATLLPNAVRHLSNADNREAGRPSARPPGSREPTAHDPTREVGLAMGVHEVRSAELGAVVDERAAMAR